MTRGRISCITNDGVSSGSSQLWAGSTVPNTRKRSIVWIGSVQIIIATLIFLYIFPAHSSEAEPIRLTTGEWPPYQSKALEHGGVATRIVTEAFAMEGIAVEYGYFPWKRSFKLAESGKWDGTFLWFDTPERREQFYISEPIIEARYVFFHLKALEFDWNTLADVAAYAIGGTLGYDYGEAFQTAEADGYLIVQRKPSDLENLSQLLKGHIQLFPCEWLVGYTLIRNKFPPSIAESITHHTKPVKVAAHHLLLSRKVRANRRRLVKFNRALQKLNYRGRLDRYLKEKFGSDNP